MGILQTLLSASTNDFEVLILDFVCIFGDEDCGC